jgi:hypothetical protein
LNAMLLRAVGAIIDMKKETIKYKFPLKKGME